MQYNVRQHRAVEIQNDVVRLLHLVDAEQQRIAADAQHVLAAVLESGIPRTAPVDCQATLARMKARYPAYLTIEVADREGTVWCSTDPRTLGISVGDYGTFQEAMRSNGIVLGEYAVARGIGRPILPFRMGYRGPDGAMAGVVTVLLDVGWLEDDLTHRNLPAGMAILLTDRNGIVMARVPARPEAVGRPLPSDMLRTLLSATDTQTIEVVGLDGVRRIVAVSPPRTGWRGTMLAVGVDRDAAMAPVNEAMMQSLAYFGGTLLLCCLGATWGLRQFLRMRERMHDTALEMASVLESTTDAVAEVDRDWKVVFLNDRAKALLPYSSSLYGRNGWEAFPELVGGTAWDRLNHAMMEREPVEFELLGPTTGLWFAARAFPSRKGLVIYFQDVSQRKQHEEERTRLNRQLEEERTLLRAVLDHMPSGVLVAEAPSGRIVKVNAAAERMLGQPLPRVIGAERLYDVPIPPGFGPHRPDGTLYGGGETPLARALLAGEVVEQEDLDYHRADGGVVTLSVSAAPVRDADGRVVLAICTLRDVGERKAMEMALHQAKEQADQANRAKSKFLAAASHDLRQPMQSMFLFSGILHRHVTGEQGQRSLEMLERGLDTLKGLLDSLLDVSRLDVGAIEPRIEAVALAGLVDEIVASYTPILESKGLSFRVAGDRAVSVRSDRVLLGRMLRNLVENAVKYTERGGVEIGLHLLDGKVRVEVADTGIGIPPDQLDQIFAEFHQVNNPERDRARGLGLGLAIVQRLSVILDHPVEVRSQPGRGSVFTIDLPLDQAEAEPPPNEAQPRGDGRAPLALLVDDDAIVLLGLRDMFREWGYEVLIAGSTDQAVERVREAGRFPDAMLVDYRLREGRVGTEAVVRIRAMAGAPVPAMILTGESGPECEQDAAQHGLKVVRKPVTPRQLRRALDRALEAGRAKDLQGTPS
nr:ATP-binding protein [Azospirillum rugosum]